MVRGSNRVASRTNNPAHDVAIPCTPPSPTNKAELPERPASHVSTKSCLHSCTGMSKTQSPAATSAPSPSTTAPAQNTTMKLSRMPPSDGAQLSRHHPQADRSRTRRGETQHSQAHSAQRSTPLPLYVL